MKTIEIIPIENLPLINAGDAISELIVMGAEKQGTPIMDHDVLVVTHKIVSKAEGRIVNLDKVTPSEEAKKLAKKTGKEPPFVEVILEETKEIVRIGPNSLITEISGGAVCANAGIDKSNIEGENNVILLPSDPDLSAQRIRNDVRRLTKKDIGVIVSDTNGRPLRMGEINVAIGVAGIKPLRDRRGEKDLFGYVLRVKQTAVADELASAAELAIGQANEGIPAAIIRGYVYQTARNASSRDLYRPKETDLLRQCQKGSKTS